MNHLHPRVFIFIILSIVMGTLSQPLKAQKIEFGIKSGVNVSTLYHYFSYRQADIVLNLDPQLSAGFNGGAILRSEVSPSIRIQIEPTVSMLGAQFDQPVSIRGFQFQSDSRAKLFYAQLPIIAQLSTQRTDRTVFGRPFNATTYHASAGIFGGYLLDADFAGTNTGAPAGIDFDGEFSNDITTAIPDYDVGTLLGIGLEHGALDKFGLEIRGLFSWEATGGTFNPRNIGVVFAAYYMF